MGELASRVSIRRKLETEIEDRDEDDVSRGRSEAGGAGVYY